MTNKEIIFTEKCDLVLNLTENSMLNRFPKLIHEWNYEKNIETDIFKISHASHKKVWWNCLKCNSEYDMTIANKTSKNFGCPFCAGRRANQTNSLSKLMPTLAREWHPTLNNKLTSKDITLGSGKNVWWLGKCGHEWEARVSARVNGNGCPFCDNKKILIGFNDMWNTNPELAKLLVNPEDGYRYSSSSGRKVDWKCPECGEISKSKAIAWINADGVKCVRCSNGFSFAEKMMYQILKELNINFKREKTFKWSKKKRYDFYLTDYNIIIEMHGSQHYDKTFESLGGDSLATTQENDKIKRVLALENNINNYFEIDVRISSLEYFKKSVLNCDFFKSINMESLNWENLYLLSQKSLSLMIRDLWTSGNNSPKMIAKELNVHLRTVTRCLEEWSKIGKIDYLDKNKEKRKVVQLSKDGDFLKEWESLTQIQNNLNIAHANIIKVCKGERKSAYGFKWMYKKDYEDLNKIV